MYVKSVLLPALLAASFSLSGQSAPQPRVVAPIDESHLLPLRGNVHPLAQARFDRGPAPASTATGRLTLILQRSPIQQQALTAYLADLQNPASPNFHRWLTPAQFGSQFGPSSTDLEAVSAWLQGHGFRIENLAPAHNFIQFSGTLEQVQSAFHTAIHAFSVQGATHFANVTDPQIPQALAPVIAGISPLNGFHAQPNLALGPQGHYDPGTHAIQPDLTLFGGSTPYLFIDPADAATIYDTPNAALNSGYSGTTYDGSGVSIGIAGNSDLTVADVQNYRVAFLGESTSTANLPVVVVDGNDPGLTGSGTEAVLDNEIAGAIAPRANIYFYTSAGSDLSDGLFNAIQRAVNDNVISILSVSFGNCEAAVGAAGNQLIAEVAEQAAAQGISMTVSSGDGGAAGCDNFDTATAAQYGFDVNAFASSPYTIAVGGTDFDALPGSFSTYANASTSGTGPYYGTALQYIPENPWNDSTSVDTGYVNNVAEKNNNNQTNIVAGSGGLSSVYAKPAFQTSLTPSDNARDLPDVSLFASNGHKQAAWAFCSDNVTDGVTGQTYTECQLTGGQFTSSTVFGGIGGTSASAPAFAGMLALIEQKTGGRLGQADTVLYQLASSNYSAIFHDITAGNNSVPCVSGSPNCGSNGFLTGYDAGTGYDLATGLGSIDVKALIANWGSAGLGSTSTSLQLNGSTAAYSGIHGANVTFKVGVNPTAATGSVAIIDTASETSGGTVSGPQNNGQFSIPLSSGSGTATYNGLPGGTYTVSARYAGDASNGASSSSPISVSISPEDSTTVLQVNAYNTLTGAAISGSTIPYGSAFFTDAHVEGKAEGSGTQGAATGTVTFANNGSTLGSARIDSSNTASWPSLAATPTLAAVGAYSYTATYSGDASYNSSTSAAVPINIVKAPTNLIANNPPSKVFGIYGNSAGSTGISFWIQSSYNLGAAPTGSITASINGQTAQTLTGLTAYASGSGASKTWLIVAYCSIPDSLFVSGANAITASYSGDANYAPSSQTITITDTDGIGTFTMTGSGDLAVVAGQQAQEQFSFTPSGGFYDFVYVTLSGIPSGVNTGANGFGYFSGTLGTVQLLGSSVSGSISFATPFNLAPGTYPITATAKDPTGKVVQTVSFNLTVTSIPANAAISVANGGAVTFPAGATRLNTASITVTPTNGFIGYLSVSCSVANGSSSVANPACKLTYPFIPMTSSTPQTISIPFTSSGAVPGTYTVTITLTDVYNSSITSTTTFPLTITAQPDVSLSSAASISMYPGTTTNATVTITPQNGFTGTVPLSCSVISSPAGPYPNGALSCQLPSSVTITDSNAVAAPLTINTVPAATLGSYKLQVDATATSPAETLNTSLIFPVTVQALPGISVSNSGNITVKPGATTGNTATIAVTPSNGFTGTVNLSCSVATLAPGVVDLPTCSLPSTVTITGNTAATATLAVNTTSPSASLEHPLRKFFLEGGGAVLAMVVFLGIPARRRSWRALLTFLAVLMITSAMTACGGGGSGPGSGTDSGGQTSGGTTPGIYTITVKAADAASGMVTASTNVALTVN